MKFTYRGKQKGRQCHYSWRPWRWFLSPRRAPRSPPLPNAPHWWWVSPQPWLLVDRPPGWKKEQRLHPLLTTAPDPAALCRNENLEVAKMTYFTYHSIPHIVNRFLRVVIISQAVSLAGCWAANHSDLASLKAFWTVVKAAQKWILTCSFCPHTDPWGQGQWPRLPVDKYLKYIVKYRNRWGRRFCILCFVFSCFVLFFRKGEERVRVKSKGTQWDCSFKNREVQERTRA